MSIIQWRHPAISSSVVPFSSCLQSFPASGSFSKELTLHIRWPKYWSFSFSISPSNEHWGLISFRIDWLDLLAIYGTLKSLLQCHSSKASILRHPAFATIQLSLPYMTTGETIPLTIQNFVGKVMSLFFNMLSRFVVAFLLRSKCLLILLLQSWLDYCINKIIPKHSSKLQFHSHHFHLLQGTKLTFWNIILKKPSLCLKSI